jgi:hypothetical protein
MDIARKRNFIYNYAFVIALITLALNDHFLKAAFGNFITGKLSDVAGMVVLPLLLAYLFPRLKTNAVWMSMLLFTFWKLPLSQSSIDFINHYIPVSIGRVIDIGDFIAFIAIPLSYYIIKEHPLLNLLILQRVRFSPAWLVVPCIFILVATAPSPAYVASRYRPATGNITMVSKNAALTLHRSQDEILQSLDASNVIYHEDLTPIDTTSFMKIHGSNLRPERHFKINKLIIEGDTLRDIQFSLQYKKPSKTGIYLNSLTIERNLTDIEAKEKLTGYYKKLLKQYFRNLN